jgi:hypothetical protein
MGAHPRGLHPPGRTRYSRKLPGYLVGSAEPHPPAPVDLDLNRTNGGIDVTFSMADASTLPQIGAVPKAVSLNELHFAQGHSGWRCSVTLDV